MDESCFDIDQQQLAESARRFPAHRRTDPPARPDADLSYLATGPAADFGRHAWDESGHI